MTIGGTEHPGQAAGKGQRWEKLSLSIDVMINSRGERMTKDLKGKRNTTDSDHNQVGETRGNRRSRHQFPHAFSGIFACGSGGSPGYDGWPLINLIPFIIIFDL